MLTYGKSYIFFGYSLQEKWCEMSPAIVAQTKYESYLGKNSLTTQKLLQRLFASHGRGNKLKKLI